MMDKELFKQQYQQMAIDIEDGMDRLDAFIAPTFPRKDNFRKEITRFTIYGGKRFRPALSLMVAQSLGYRDIRPHLALEVFHKYLLMHDDIIDRDTKRYGLPTIHAKMAATHKDVHMAEHFGNSLAIIGGDLLAAATQKVILDSAVSDKTKVALQKLIVQAIEEVAWGWYDQFLMDYLPLDSKELSVKRIEDSTVWVTGRYSIKLPLLFGYAVAGKEAPSSLEYLADILGILYQTGDDLIGLFGQEELTGKSSYGDIMQGKKTLPMYVSYQLATTEDKKTLVGLVGKKDLTQKEVAMVRAILQRSGGLQRTQELVKEYSNEAITLLESLTMPPELRRFLRGFVDYIMTRNI